MEKPDHLLHWIEKGLLTQSNIGSFSGQFKEKTAAYAKWLYDHRAVHFLGSDAHRTDWRNADTRDFQERLDAYTGNHDFIAACDAHAAMILKNRIYYADPPLQNKPHKKGFFARLFGE